MGDGPCRWRGAPGRRTLPGEPLRGRLLPTVMALLSFRQLKCKELQAWKFFTVLIILEYDGLNCMTLFFVKTKERTK